MNNKSFSDNRGELIFPFKDNKYLGEIMQCTVSKNKKMYLGDFTKIILINWLHVFKDGY